MQSNLIQLHLINKKKIIQFAAAVRAAKQSMALSLRFYRCKRNRLGVSFDAALRLQSTQLSHLYLAMWQHWSDVTLVTLWLRHLFLGFLVAKFKLKLENEIN